MSELYNILDKVTPEDDDHYVEQRKLLWENSSPSSSFAAQTLTVTGASSYSEILLETADGGLFNPKNTMPFNNTNQASNTCDVMGRWINLSGDTLSVNNCEKYSVTGGVWGTNNNILVPYKIYGIKKLGGVVRQIAQQIIAMLPNKKGGICYVGAL